MAKLAFENISHSYQVSADEEFSQENIEWAIKDMNIVWKDGTANALLGPSGCGKTTMLNILSGLLKPTEGKVLIDGQVVNDLPPQKRHIAQVFQFPVIYDSMDVYNNLAFPLVNKKVKKARIDKKVNEVAEILNLKEYLRSPSRDLNSAEKQKVSLGRGIIRDDTVAILLDEPLTVIDPKMRGELRRSLKMVQEELSITMIYVTHDQHEALTFADYVTIVKAGKYLQGGTPHELYSEPEDPFVGYFIGSPGMNVIECSLEKNQIKTKEFSITISDSLKQKLGEVKEMELGIRPEELLVYTSNKENTISFEVIVIENMGNYKILTLKKNELRIKVRVDLELQVEKNGQLFVEFPEKKMKLFKNKERIY